MPNQRERGLSGRQTGSATIQSIEGGIINYLERVARDGSWTYEAHDLRITSGLPGIVAERLIENSRHLLTDPEFDFGKYADLVITAYKRFGRTVSSYFSLSYGSVFRQGISPDDYFKLTESAVEEGGKGGKKGKEFAAWYVYSLPGVMKAGCDPEQFKSKASVVNKIGGIRMVKPFVLNAATALETGISIPEFSDLTIQATRTLGKETAYWVIRNMAYLARLGHNPYDFLEECKALLAEKGEKAARWYASGFTDLIEAKKDIEQRLYEMKEDLQREPNNWSLRRALNYWESRNTSLNPLEFRDGYFKLLLSLGQSAATFYSLSARPKWPQGFFAEERMEGVRQLPDKIFEFHEAVNKKVFNAAMWYVLKITDDPSKVVELLEKIAEASKTKDAKSIRDALRYTYGNKKINHTVDFESELERQEVVVGDYEDEEEGEWGYNPYE